MTSVEEYNDHDIKVFENEIIERLDCIQKSEARLKQDLRTIVREEVLKVLSDYQRRGWNQISWWTKGQVHTGFVNAGIPIFNTGSLNGTTGNAITVNAEGFMNNLNMKEKNQEVYAEDQLKFLWELYHKDKDIKEKEVTAKEVK